MMELANGEQRTVNGLEARGEKRTANSPPPIIIFQYSFFRANPPRLRHPSREGNYSLFIIHYSL